MGAETEGVGTPTPDLPAFFLTFGVMYRHETHPFWEQAHPDGWLLVLAPDEDAARLVVRRYIGNKYAFIYPEDRFQRKWHPMGELGRVVTDGKQMVLDSGGSLVAQFTESDPQFYGRDENEHIAHRIEGILAVGSDEDCIKELGYEAETFHPGCADEGRVMFKSITEEDDRVLAFELDWSEPNECPVCGEGIL